METCGTCVSMNRSQPKMMTLAVPQPESQRDRYGTKQPQRPDRRTMVQHLFAVADLIERTKRDVGSVGHTAESGKKTRQVRDADCHPLKRSPDKNWQCRSDDWPGPDDNRRIGVQADVRTRDRKGMQDNSFHFGSGHDRTQNMAEFMHGLHAVPRHHKCRDDQKELVPLFHGIHHTADHFRRTINNLRVAPLQHGFTGGVRSTPPPYVCSSSAFDSVRCSVQFSWRVVILPLLGLGCEQPRPPGNDLSLSGWPVLLPQHGFIRGLRSTPPPYVCSSSAFDSVRCSVQFSWRVVILPLVDPGCGATQATRE